MAAIAGAILLEDGRPILFRQERVGRARRPFHVLKFRSMRGDRVTRVGKLLRATGLDELPQFLNILRGEMSAVGPRPLTASDIRRLGWDAPRYDFRPLLRAGGIGWDYGPGLLLAEQRAGYRELGAKNCVQRAAKFRVPRWVASICMFGACRKRVSRPYRDY